MLEMVKDETRKLRALTTFLRVYGVLSFVIFIPLFVGFIVETPLLAEDGGPLNWTIWNDVMSGHDPAQVPPMLFLIYIVWGVFLLLAARKPLAYVSFLSFTMWTNLAHGLLMAVMAAMDMERYWSKFLTDVPFILILALGIYLWRPTSTQDASSASAPTGR
jgi:hypothetical protein